MGNHNNNIDADSAQAALNTTDPNLFDSGTVNTQRFSGDSRLLRQPKRMDPRLDNSVPADIREYTSWMELTRLPRQSIGWGTPEMFDYEHPGEDYDADPDNVISTACMNIAKLGLEIKELGDLLPRYARQPRDEQL